MKDRFEHILQEKLRDHTVRPDARDWALIERSLGDAVKIRRIRPLWRYAAAAAAVLLVAVGGFRLWNREPVLPVERFAASNDIPSITDSAVPGEKSNDALKAVRNLKAAIDRAAVPVVSTLDITDVQGNTKSVRENPSAPERTEWPAVEEADRRPGGVSDGSRRLAVVLPPSRPRRRSRTPNNNWALSLFANGTGGNRNAGSPSDHQLLLAMNRNGALSQSSPDYQNPSLTSEDNISSSASSYLLQYDQSRSAGLLSVEVAAWEHARPLSAGFRVRRNLTERWGLETGLTYSYLRSKQETSSVTRKQELHYLGVPLAVTFTPLRKESFELYARAGGAADFNIGGRTSLKTGEIKAPIERFTVRGIQWSLTANAGAMYRFTPSLGLYLEPGVSHRFEFNGQPESFWSQHPTGFTLQIGIRADF